MNAPDVENPHSGGGASIDPAAGPSVCSDSGAGGLRWHQALAWAATGQAHPELGEQARPDLAALAERMTAGSGGREIEELIADRRARGATWPIGVPSELMAGLSAAQFTAALTELRRHLTSRSGLTAGSGLGSTARPVLSSRAPDAAERRLLEDVPPHHGV